MTYGVNITAKTRTAPQISLNRQQVNSLPQGTTFNTYSVHLKSRRAAFCCFGLGNAVGHVGISQVLFSEYWELGRTTPPAYCCSRTLEWGIRDIRTLYESLRNTVTHDPLLCLVMQRRIDTKL